MALKYEAELAALVGAQSATNHDGFSGSGFVDYVNLSGDYTEFAIEVDAAGLYDLSFRYALGASASRSLQLSIDGVVVSTLEFGTTGAWATWQHVIEPVQLTAGSHTVRLTAIGTSGPNLDALTVTSVDNETPPTVLNVSLDATSISENGGTAIGTLSRSDPNGDLVVTLSSSDLSEATVPPQVTLLNGQTTAQFAITAVDDAVVDGSQTVAITASATAVTGDTAFLTITDDDLAAPPVTAVTYEAELATLSGATVATNHGGFWGDGFVDYLNPSGDYTEFSIAVEADGLYDLSLRYALGARAARSLQLAIDGTSITTLNFAPTGDWSTWSEVVEAVALTAGTHVVRLTAIGTSGPNLDRLTVTSADSAPPPTDLDLSLTASSISENGGTTVGTLSRSGTEGDLVVALTSSDPSEATVPAEVTILNGQTSTTFAITAVDDTLVDGTQTVNITASATNALGVTGSLSVTDDDSTGGGDAGCSSISLLPCTDVRIEGDFVFDFNGTDGGLGDQDGEGLGFTMVDPSSNPSNPTPRAGVVGYFPALLDVDAATGLLQITTTAGIQFQAHNSLDNALGVGLNVPSQAVRLHTTLVDLPTAGGGYSQAGLWFGQATNGGAGSSEDNYIKLIVISDEPGQYRLQALMEQAGQEVLSQSAPLNVTAASQVDLELFIDPGTETVTASYSVDGGAQQTLATLTSVPSEWFSFDQAGLNPEIATRSFGGIFATHRNAGAAQVYSFDDFGVTEAAPGTPGTEPPGGGDPLPNLPFDRWSIPISNATAMDLGPDGRLYVATLFGTIHALDFDLKTRTWTDQVIDTLRTAEGGNRLTLGLVVDPDSTADNVMLWVGHSSGSVNNGDLNSSKISRLSGSHLAIKEDVVTGLPRAIANHALNNLDFGPNGKLYAWMGGNTGAGAANTAPSEFGDRPEQPLSAALIEIDIPRWKADPNNFHGEVASPIVDGVAEFIDDFYARKAQELGRPLDEIVVYASGLRNTYDGVFHSNGNLYAPDNGLGVTGTFPSVGPNSVLQGDPTNDADITAFGINPGDNPGKQPDPLNLIEAGNWYGHPNPARREVIFKDGSAQGLVGNFPPGHPAYTEPLTILGTNKSANGIIEYTADNFFGQLRGDLLIANYSSGDDLTRLQLSADGRSVVSSSSLVGGFTDPLPILMGPNGTIIVGEFNGGLTILESLGIWRDDLPNAPVSVLDAGSAVVNGKLYAIAGKTNAAHIDDLYIYDPGDPFSPLDDTWTTGPDYLAAVENLAVATYDDKIYAFGGSTAPFSGAVTTAGVFDPLIGQWSAITGLPTARAGATAQVLNDQIFVIGGLDANGASVDTVDVYDPLTGQWSTAPQDLQVRRDNPGSAVIEGKLVVFGGRTRNGDGSVVSEALTSLEIYDPIADQWSFGASMSTGRRTLITSTLNDRLQVTGGEAGGNTYSQMEEYDILTDTWRTLPAIGTPRHGAVYGVIDDVLYVAMGGPQAGSTFTNTVEAFTF